MPVTAPAVAAFLAELNAARPVTCRKMFGGVGLYADGVFFGVIDDDRLYFKAGPHNDADFDAFSAETWVIQGETPQVMPYREVPLEVRCDPSQLEQWIGKAVEIAVAKKRK